MLDRKQSRRLGSDCDSETQEKRDELKFVLCNLGYVGPNTIKLQGGMFMGVFMVLFFV